MNSVFMSGSNCFARGFFSRHKEKNFLCSLQVSLKLLVDVSRLWLPFLFASESRKRFRGISSFILVAGLAAQ